MNATADQYDLLKGLHVAGPEYKPRTVAELRVRESILEDIGLRTLYLYGPFSVADLSEQSGLSYDAAEQLLSRLRAKLRCEVTGMTGTVPASPGPPIESGWFVSSAVVLTKNCAHATQEIW